MHPPQLLLTTPTINARDTLQLRHAMSFHHGSVIGTNAMQICQAWMQMSVMCVMCDHAQQNGAYSREEHCAVVRKLIISVLQTGNCIDAEQNRQAPCPGCHTQHSVILWHALALECFFQMYLCCQDHAGAEPAGVVIRMEAPMQSW